MIFHYDISLWLEQSKIDNKSVIKTGIYNHEDPEELFKLVLKEFEAKKVKLGVVLH